MDIIVDNLPGLLASLLACFLCFVAGRIWENRKRLKLYGLTCLKRNENVRISAAYLFRVVVDGKYLLIRGKRITTQYQPVGGVYQYYESARGTLDGLAFQPDDSMKSNSSDPNDLRIVVPRKNVIPFLDWFDKGIGREICVIREFREELVEPGYVSKAALDAFSPELIRHCDRKLGYSKHFKMSEMLVHDVYEVRLSQEEQKRIVEYASKHPGGELILVGRSEIERETFEQDGSYFTIAPTAGETL